MFGSNSVSNSVVDLRKHDNIKGTDSIRSATIRRSGAQSGHRGALPFRESYDASSSISGGIPVNIPTPPTTAKNTQIMQQHQKKKVEKKPSIPLGNWKFL